MITTTSAAPYIRRAKLTNSRWFGSHLFSFLATGLDTDGQFALMEVMLATGQEPPAHTHRVDDEGFYILGGEIEFRIGCETVLARKGDFVLLPAGIEHSFRVLGARARALLISAPGGLDEAFIELSQPARRMGIRTNPPPLDLGRFVTAFGRQGLTFAPVNAPPVDLQVKSNPALATHPAVGLSRWYRGQLLTPLTTGSETNGRFAVIEALGCRGEEPPLHVHEREDEGFYLLDGEVTFHCEGRVFEARAGDFVFLPRGLPHRFEVRTEVARVLILLTPAGFENYFIENSQPAQTVGPSPLPVEDANPEAMIRSCAHYGVEFPMPTPDSVPAGGISYGETLTHTMSTFSRQTADAWSEAEI